MRDINKKNTIFIFIIFILVLFVWFLFRERQAELPYRVIGAELLQIKIECKELAEAKVANLNDIWSGGYQLKGHGYSERGGYCYAEILQEFDDFSSKLLYNTTQGKEVFQRQWPENISWYEHDFDLLILGRSRIVDFRAP